MADKNTEYEEWCEVYEYFKREIMNYPDDFKLPQKVVLRLKGLQSGKFMSNKKVKSMSNYSYKTILLTMKLCRGKISTYLSKNKNNFNSESHKINGILLIIESEINNVAVKIKNAKKAESKTVNANLEHQTVKGANYIKKESKKENKNIEDLW